jgi:hypothetical protein
LAEEVVSSEPVSGRKFPVKQGKYRGIASIFGRDVRNLRRETT